MLKLGVNIDHVATLRQARGGDSPSIEDAARAVMRGGADLITMHLREDRRHIQDDDLLRVRKVVSVPINLEMALHPEIIKIALQFRPQKVCIVPERRKELTTEGGLDLLPKRNLLKKIIPRFEKLKIEVSLFLDPIESHLLAAEEVGAHAVELHTGTYANARTKKQILELKRIAKAAIYATSLGLKVHAGHGLDYQNTKAIAKIPQIEELNIGHSIVSHALSVGLTQAVHEMKQLMCRAS